jgi:hypothetical protein
LGTHTSTPLILGQDTPKFQISLISLTRTWFRFLLLIGCLHARRLNRKASANVSTVHPRPPIAAITQRRSQRIVLSVQLLVTGNRMNSAPISEHASTAIVNAHGALILLREPVLVGQVLVLQNLVTMEEIACTVVDADVSPGAHGEQEIGVEFAQECPRFWRVSFPPADWSPRSAEAKQIVRLKKPNAADVPVVATPRKK